MAVDDAYAEWYKARFGKTIDRSYILPVIHALQGHPESGRLWEDHINKILLSPELNFRHTTHDRTIYSATFDDEPVLLLRQVDDFSLACKNEAIAKYIYGVIGDRLKLEHEDCVPFVYLGLTTEYNGVDVKQTRDHISILCSTYIHRVLRSHNWLTPGPNESDTTKCVPMSAEVLPQLYKEVGPPEGSPEHANLAAEQGFAYRTLLGELFYAYIACRPDIGYVVVTLSKFAVTPCKFRYLQLKRMLLSTFVALLTGALTTANRLLTLPCLLALCFRLLLIKDFLHSLNRRVLISW